jgi:DNA-binding NarL/FixJ family response regulator
MSLPTAYDRVMGKLRILCVECPRIFTAGVETVLAEEVEVVGLSPNSGPLVQAVLELEIDVVLINVSAPRKKRFDDIRELKARTAKIGVIVVTADISVASVEAAFRAGVDGYVLSTCAISELRTALREVMQGNMYVAPAMAKDVLGLLIERSPSQPGAKKLTGRQREVLELIAEGYSTKKIAAALDIAPKTAESHRYALMKQLDLHTTADLTRYAIRQGVISAD